MTQFEESRRLDDDFRFYGVVVTVIADKPLESYPGAPGVGCSSQADENAENFNGHKFSVNIVDFTFISEFEPMPETTADPALCWKTYEPDQHPGVLGDGFRYSPEFFTKEALIVLLKDYVIWFLAESEEIGLRQRKKLELISRAKEEGESKDEIVVVTKGLDLKDVEFGKTTVSFGDLQIGPIVKMRIVEKSEE
jgi:hypothetical protein